MSAADFEARYRADPDPWGYLHSDYEREKYDATLAACGQGPFDSALELGASIGVFSQLLAPRCRRLVTIDAAPTAVAAARSRLSAQPQVEVLLGGIPDAVPEETFDLVVASEILYYLTPAELADTLTVLERRMATGARLVAVHWRPGGPERPFDAEAAHRRLHEQSWLTMSQSGGTDEYLLEVIIRR
jgi:cyclopropane fatty-acyl-phospholipid synthase-like methyltransferase